MRNDLTCLSARISLCHSQIGLELLRHGHYSARSRVFLHSILQHQHDLALIKLPTSPRIELALGILDLILRWCERLTQVLNLPLN